MKPHSRRVRLAVSTCAGLVIWTATTACAADAAKIDKDEVRALKRAALAEGVDPKAKPMRDSDGKRIDKKPVAAPSSEPNRTLDRLRERLEVTDEAEWTLISERITRVEEARRVLWAAPGGTGLVPEKRTGSNAKSPHPERDALKAALGERLPDAEISLRLARAREVHRQNEAKLARAQADLRAVLSVRQEAVAVMAGLLPP